MGYQNTFRPVVRGDRIRLSRREMLSNSLTSVGTKRRRIVPSLGCTLGGTTGERKNNSARGGKGPEIEKKKN